MSYVQDGVTRRCAQPCIPALWLLFLIVASMPAGAQDRAKPSDRAAAAPVSAAAPRLTFEENRGQLDPQVRFVSRSPRDTLFLTADEAVLSLKGQATARALRMRFRNGNAKNAIVGIDPLSPVTYYAKATTRGRLEPTRSYHRVRYSNVYPGIDLEYYRTDGNLEFDLNVAPGSSPAPIELSFTGARAIAREPDGDLAIDVAGEQIVLKRPVVFQERDGTRLDVDGDYVVSGTTVRFALGDYDRSLTLVIDPVIVYATYLGGGGDDEVIGAELDEAGDLYLFGRTDGRQSFPSTHTDPAIENLDPVNCFVSKVSADGQTLLSSVIFESYGICQAFEVEGNRGALATSVHVAMQSMTGNSGGLVQLRTVTFVEGSVEITPLKGIGPVSIDGQSSQVEDIRTDGFGNTYVLYHQQREDATLQARLMKVNAAGAIRGILDLDLVPDAAPSARAMAVDNFGQVFVVGSTLRAITTSPGAFQPTRPQVFNCGENGFLIRVDTSVEPFAPTYASYIAGDGCDTVLGIARDPLGYLYLTGRSTSEELPFIGERSTGGPAGDGFLLKLDASEHSPDLPVIAGRFLGLELGTGSEGVTDVFHPLVRLPTGELVLTGGARGGDFPLHNPLFDATGAPGFPRFLRIFEPLELQDIVSTHLDSTGAATHSVVAAAKGSGLSINAPSVLAITRTTENGLATTGALQDQLAGGIDLVIRKIGLGDVVSNSPPFFDLGAERTIEAGDANGADFDLNCPQCSIADFSDSVAQLVWTINGVRQTPLSEPFIGQITLPVGRHQLELVVIDTRGAATSDTLVVQVLPPAVNNPPAISLAPSMTVQATSPNGTDMWVLAGVSDPDSEPLDLTWVVPAVVTIQTSVSPPFYSNNAATRVRLPIGTHVATLSVGDRRGQIVNAQTTIVVNGINTATAGETITLVDDNLQTITTFTPGRMTVTFDNVASPGLTWFRTRLDQLPPPPNNPQPMQLGSSPNYYDLATTAAISGDVRVCIDTTGMSFVDPAATRLYRHDGTSWQDVTRTATAGEAAARMICGVAPAEPALGTFAIFTPAAEATRVTTIIGNGDPFTPGTAAPGDGGPATLAPLTPGSLAFDIPRQRAYVSDGGRLRRVDLQTNTITTIAGNFGGIADERDGVDARDFPFASGPIAIDRDGNIFFAGLNACSINRIDAQTNVVRRVAGLGPHPVTLECRYDGDGGRATLADLHWSGGLAFDADGNLFFAQLIFGAPGTGSGSSIRRIAAGPDHLITGDDPFELITTVAGGGTTWPPQSGDPRAALIDAADIAFNAQGDMYVSGTAVVVRITPAPGSQLVDGRAGELLRVVAGQALVTYAPYEGDGRPALEANFMTMGGIEILPNGDLAIAETGANRIRIVNAGPDGIVNGDANERIRTIAGFSENTWDTSLLRFNGDGYALSTAFNSPLDVVVDPRGGIAIVDVGFNRVRHMGTSSTGTAQIDLAVAASATATQVSAFEAFSYIGTVSNLTPVAAQATLNVTLAPNVRFDGSTPAALCTAVGDQVTCGIGTLAGGQTMEIRIHVTPQMVGSATATFVVSNPEGDRNPADNTATVAVTSALVIRETITVSDTVDPRPALQLAMTETIHVSDTVEPRPAVQLVIAETIQVTDHVTSTVSDEADLAIAVVPSRTLLNVGNPISFAVTITNTGTTARVATLSIPAPSGLAIDQIHLPPLQCLVIFGIGSWSCGLGDLTPGARLEFAVDAHATSGPSATISFSVASSVTDPQPANNSVALTIAVNRPPVVDAGPDREVVATTNPTGVPVSASVTDPDGDAITSIAWFDGTTFLVNGAFPELALAVGTHTLTVVAIDNRGGQSSDSVVINVRPATLPRPTAVLASSGAPGQATVNWAPVPGAAEYRVYRSVDPVTTTTETTPAIELLTSNATLAATVSDTAFQDNGLPALVRQFYAVVAVNGATVSQPRAAAQVIVQAHPNASIFGFADTHNHQFANLGFGRSLIWGSAFSDTGGLGDALHSCELAHGFGGFGDIIGNFLTQSVGHDTGGFNPASTSEFTGWPSFDTRTHQQAYYEWVQRAFEGGQRLMVMHAINTKVLCQVAPHDSQFSCEDMASIEAQLLEAKRLENYVDQLSGGPGRGWYRIAYSGNEARRIINSGKMAVVLGIEVDELFGCGRNATCTLDDIRTRLDHFHDLGVRHLFPIGHFDNAFGGAALYDPLYNYANFVQTGAFFAPRACTTEGYRYAPGAVNPSWLSILSVIAGAIPGAPVSGFAAECNARGLLGLGEFLVREMMARGMIIDIDHMSSLAANRVLTIAEQHNYPGVVSGHSGPLSVSTGSKANEGAKTTSQLARISSLGGLSSIFLNQGERGGDRGPNGIIAHGSMVANDCSGSSKTLAQAYLAAVDAAGGPATAVVGFGTDFNGLGGQPGPRFGSRRCPGDAPVVDQNGGVAYPFDIVAPAGINAGTLGRATLPRRLNNMAPEHWDFNQDGLAHAGMVPDLIADLRSVGVSDTYLQPLFRSAEAYVGMWERADGSAPPFQGGTVLNTGVDALVRASSVSGSAQPVTATFANVTEPGYLVAEPMENPPPPPSTFVFLGFAFDLITTATYTGPITVCLEDSSYTSSDELLHFESGSWVNITTAGNSDGTVCGQTTSLSPFVVARSLNSAPSANAGTYAPFEATSPAGATVTLSGSGSDPDAGDILTFRWTKGDVVLGSAPTISATLALGTHDVTFTVTDSHGASASSTTRVVVTDTTPPAVTPPSALAIPATEALGARASAWPALATWLASATARDLADAAPVGLTAEVNGTPVTAATLFRIGTTTVRFTFRDAAGNVGSATSTVNVSVGRPRFETALVGSGTLPGGRRYVDLSVRNTGTGIAQRTTMVVVALPAKGLGIITMRTPQPIAIGDLSPGASRTVRIEMTIPGSVKEVLLVTAGAFLNVQFVPDAFSTQHTFKP